MESAQMSLDGLQSEVATSVDLQMPVKCPISSVLKRRKLQGRDCFEVSWEEMRGLKASIVPADLVESACPEKILEFQERRAPRKTKNQGKLRPKKPQNGTLVEEVEHKLQQLIVDLEQESATKRFNTLSRGPMLEKGGVLMQADPTNQELFLETKLESKTGKTTSSTCSATTSSFRETEVIDLMSPSPPMNACSVSKCKEADVQCIVDLADSENEISSEHARKARELRLFIANIRDD